MNSRNMQFAKKELLNNGYEYGFYLNGIKYKPDITKGYDEEFACALVNDYRIQNPLDTCEKKLTPQSHKPRY